MMLFSFHFNRERAEEEGGHGNGEDEEEDLIAKAEEDFFTSISAEVEGRKKKFGERNEAFEQAKEAIGHDRLPFESLSEEKSLNGVGDEKHDDDNSTTTGESNGVSCHYSFYKNVLFEKAFNVK